MVKKLSDRVAVMYLGQLVEVAPADQLYRSPVTTTPPPCSTPCQCLTRAAVAPAAGSVASCPRRSTPERVPLPHPVPRAEQRCADEEPPLAEASPGHLTACHFPLPEETASR